MPLEKSRLRIARGIAAAIRAEFQRQHARGLACFDNETDAVTGTVDIDGLADAAALAVVAELKASIGEMKQEVADLEGKQTQH